MTPDLRPSPIAGTWYPGTPEALAESVDRHLSRADVVPPPGAIVALVAPHAGHLYSGQVAALAFRCLRGTAPRVVAVISPLHRPHAARVLTTAHEAYATPLGNIPVDLDLLDRFERRLEHDHAIHLERVRKDSEHSLEIELPFLQRVLTTPFWVLPLMLRDQGCEVVEAVGHALASVLLDEPAVMVASSDLSHFYSGATARRLDAEVLARVEAFNPAGVLSAEDEGLGFACGRGAIAAVLWAARDLGANRVQILGYATSGDVTGDHASVVGYGAAAIYRSAETL
jgi:AmmeMemoRadiSam system protein B